MEKLFWAIVIFVLCSAIISLEIPHFRHVVLHRWSENLTCLWLNMVFPLGEITLRVNSGIQVSSRISRDFTANANITRFVSNLFYYTIPTLSEHKIRYLRQFLSKRVNWFKFVKACKLGFNASSSYQSAFKLAMNCSFSTVVSEKSMTVHQKQAVANFCCLFVIRHPIFSTETIAFYLSP